MGGASSADAGSVSIGVVVSAGDSVSLLQPTSDMENSKINRLSVVFIVDLTFSSSFLNS